jgi:hypothetical protein
MMLFGNSDEDWSNESKDFSRVIDVNDSELVPSSE